MDAGAGEFGQHLRAGDQIIVPVGLENMADATVVGQRDGDIDLDVATRIDDRGLASTSHHVGQMGQAGRLHLFDEHRCAPSWTCRALNADQRGGDIGDFRERVSGPA